MSLREWCAGLAMQGIAQMYLGLNGHPDDYDGCAVAAKGFADALLKELEKTP